ncbi:ABC transporter ATP-binding protein [Jeotgalicoccus sp. S0W5]|uniref:ATP-binding cassette domain-containing protein n=1 Tax=Jeotgalicoccus sp. S0W5 TaxID=2527874 RepID=UPI00141516FD|nr:ABC transporter ATP-binding protein [Jeotgalicoccus sp. S0W5]
MNLNIENVGLSINKEEILSDINVTFTPGKIYGLLGRNGAGKTSLISLIASYRKATQGSITLDGKTIYEKDEMMQHVNFIYNVKDTSSETDKVKEYPESHAMFRDDFDQEYANELLKKFKIDENKNFNELSQGQQAAVNASMGLASLSKVTIFDEVTNGMDAPTRELFYEEVLQAKRRGTRIIILSTHIISEMEHLFDEIVMMHNGKILLQEPTDDLLEKGFTVAGKAEKVREFTANKNVINVKFLGALQIDTVIGYLSPEEMAFAEDNHLDISRLALQELFISLTNDDKGQE